jgi:Domain of unknown function (DUF1330)
MPAYVIAETDVTDPERYEQYKAASSTAIAAGGGLPGAVASWLVPHWGASQRRSCGRSAWSAHSAPAQGRTTLSPVGAA